MSTTVLVLAGLLAFAVAALTGWLFLRADRLTEEGRTHRPRRGPPTGTVLAVATVAGALGIGAAWLDGRSLVLLALAAVLGAFGLAVERRRLRPAMRVAAEAAAGGAAVVLGLRSGLTGTALTSAVLVVAFVVVMVEALRLLDAAPRVAPAVAIPSLVALAVVARGAGQDGVAILALALAGALAGLVAAGTRRQFWLGESGCLFCGFLLATLVVAVSPATPAPLSIAVLLPVVAVPLVNSVVVSLDRLRRRRALTARRPDGLPHRLRAVPLPWLSVVLVLGGVQALLSLVVVLADRGIVSVAAPLLVGAASMALLALPVATRSAAKIHRHPAPGLSPTSRLVGLALVVAAGVVVLPSTLALVSVRRQVVAGAEAAERGLAAARKGEVEAAATAFDQARASFAVAADRTDGPLTSLGLGVPVLGPHLSAARDLSDLGLTLSGTGATVATAVTQGLSVTGGRVPVDEIARLAPDLARAAGDLRQAQRTTSGIQRSFLLPSLRARLVDLDARLEQAGGEAELAAQTAEVLPAILGGEGPRRYFLAIQNNAELRATGGFIGNFGELVAENGRLRLERIGRVRELNQAGSPVKDLQAPQDYLDRYSRFDVASTWQSVNLSPDLPSVGQVIQGLYPQSGGIPIDGVIVIDPIGLAGILQLTGPVDVEPWPEPITADNVVDVTLNQAYIDFDNNDDRIDFIGDVAEMAATVFTSADLGSPTRILKPLGQPARGGHLAAWFTRPEEQALADVVGIAGRVEPTEADSLLVVNQNAGAGKIDYYFRRRLDYDVQLRPDGDLLGVTGRLRIDMENQAPDEGLPPYIIGPFNERFQAGENFSYFSLYSPLALTGATWDGAPIELDAEEELGRNVYSAFLSIPARSTRSLEVQLEGSVAPQGDGWYELDLLHQPLLVGDDVTISVEVVDGWRIAEAEGAQLEAGRGAVARLRLEQNETVRVRLVQG